MSTPSPRLSFGCILLVAALGGCFLGAAAGVAIHLARASSESRMMSVPAACRYLHLIPGSHGRFPSAAALRYVAGHVSPAGDGRTFAAAAGRSASDLAAPSLAHIARLGPDFAVVMNGCP